MIMMILQGLNCENCIDGFFGNPVNGGTCQKCECNDQGSLCDHKTGNCFCNTKGRIVFTVFTVSDTNVNYDNNNYLIHLSLQILNN